MDRSDKLTPNSVEPSDVSILQTARNNRDNSKDVERPKNGQVDQQIRRRPLRAVATSRTTNGFSHSHSFGLRGSQSSPKTRWSSYRPTPNDYHNSGSANGPNDGNDAAPCAAPLEGKAATSRTVWELPKLIQPLHRRRKHFIRNPRLLPHYPAVVEFTYNHRFVTGWHIQRRFRDYMRSPRTSQYQLANLVRLGFLAYAPVRSTSPNFPAVYVATRQGIALIKETYASHDIDWAGTATEQIKATGIALDSILHELLLTEFELAIRATTESRGDLTLLMQERRYFRATKQLAYETAGRTKRVIPDAGFLVRQTNGHAAQLGQYSLQLCFVEMDNGTLSTERLAEKYRDYTKWSVSPECQRYLQGVAERYGSPNTCTGFRLLVIARGNSNDERRLQELLRLALVVPRKMRDRIWLTTVTDLKTQEDPSRVLAEPIWIRVRDACAWIPTLRAMTSENRHSALAIQRRFIATHTRHLPRHTLFSRAHDASQ